MGDDQPAGGRLKRLAKLAGLGARLSGEVAARGVKRLTGDATGMLSSAGAEKLVATLGELKGLAMKVGQSLAMDPDLLTPEVQAIVARLQNQAPPMSWETVKGVLGRELGEGAAARFSSFDERPLASASLGQVHGAVTKEGLKVAVKVQYPGVDRALESDLANIESTAVVFARAAGVPAQSYFSEIREALLEELDYRLEARNGALMMQACEGLTDLHLPRVYEELSSARVLTEERLEGETLKDFLARRALVPNHERFRVARLLIRAAFGPFLEGAVFQADPHPGNYVLLPDGRMGLLDFGNVRRASPTWVSVNRRLIEIGLGAPALDVVALSREAGFTMKVGEEKLRPFIEGVVELVLEPLRPSSYDYGSAQPLKRMRALMMKHALVVKTKMQPPPEALLFFRAMGGLMQNLQSLGAQGSYRQVYEELIAATAKSPSLG